MTLFDDKTDKLDLVYDLTLTLLTDATLSLLLEIALQALPVLLLPALMFDELLLPLFGPGPELSQSFFKQSELSESPAAEPIVTTQSCMSIDLMGDLSLCSGEDMEPPISSSLLDEFFGGIGGGISGVDESNAL
ncbi:hypothetical protein GQX74_007582 [Glossina fuscipes]|nr:hypothetical protein GQX74_007582 [Glossina fuscipes]